MRKNTRPVLLSLLRRVCRRSNNFVAGLGAAGILAGALGALGADNPAKVASPLVSVDQPFRAPDRPKSGHPWADMDYGPFLTASIEAPQPATNLAYKGVAIRLGQAFGGTQNEAVVFDTDLLRYAAGWTGNFVALKGVVFDGEHWAYPHIDGEQVFGSPDLPGWAKAGSFADPRPFIYGPLPRDWAHWKGLYLHGDQVVLAYSVGAADVLELPGLEKAGGLTAFSRTLNIGRSEADLTVQLAFEADHTPTLLSLDGLNPAPPGAAAAQALVWLARPPVVRPVVGEAALSRDLLGKWDFDEGQGDLAADGQAATRPIQLHGHQWAQGHAGTAVAFDGAGFGEIQNAQGLEFLERDFTFAAWIKATEDGVILSQAAPTGPWAPDSKALFIRNGRLTFDVGWVGAVAGRQRIADGRWTHVALAWSHRDGLATLFVNGVTDGERVLKPKQPRPTYVVRLGYAAPNFPEHPYFKGQIDEVRLYARRLTSAEVRALAGPAPEQDILVVGGAGLPEGCQWVMTSNGHVRLQIPSRSTPAQFKVLLARLPRAALPRFGQLVRDAAPAPDLRSLTHGGPSHWSQTLVTRGQLGATNGPYAIDRITWPADNPWHSWMRFGGFDFFQDATRAAICTWSGDVWLVSGLGGDLQRLTWRRFATGLYQPLGLKIVDDQIYVLGRDQITRLHDLNGDGESDYYENFNNDTMNTEHFHEFALDLQTDAAGNFYYMKCARHALDALHPQHGTLMKVSQDGTHSEIVANGFRAPNGLEIIPDGEFFTTDQEGFWMPANRLDHIRPGRFYGNVWSWFPGAKPTTNEPPICWIHPSVDRSPSTMAWVNSDRWGPLHAQLLSLSYGVGRIFLVMRETINGLEQGGITPLPVEFDTGIMRARFHPGDGQLYVCGLYGWASNKTRDGGFYRVRYTGQPLYLPNELHIANNGVVLHFSQPLDPTSALDPGNYSVHVWNYQWTKNYGSPDFQRNGQKGRDRLPVESVGLSQDAQTAFLKLPDLGPVMQMHLEMHLKAADGTPLPTYVHNSVHTLGKTPGENWLGDHPLGSLAAAPAELTNTAPGLVVTFTSPRAPPFARSDSRLARLVALRLPPGSPPTPFLPPGPFEATWRGFLSSPLGEEYSFQATGLGQVTVKINGQTVVSHLQSTLSSTAQPTIHLKGGLNPVEVSYHSPPSGDAALRLFWSNAQLPPEPIPPTVLVHEAGDPGLHQGELRRTDRALFASRQCVKCHLPSATLGATMMPELAAEAPSLEGRGDRLNPSWVVRWLAAPETMAAASTMPDCLHGSAAEREAQARDIAAFLITLSTEPSTGKNKVADLARSNRAQTGAALYAKLGCVACHVLPGDSLLSPDERWPLGQVSAKWQPLALLDYLRKPQRYNAWTRMPDFQLTTDEAGALAAYLLSRAEPSPDEPKRSGGVRPSSGAASSNSFRPFVLSQPAGLERGTAPGDGHTPASRQVALGDAQRGRELMTSLGCVNCHPLNGLPQRQLAPPLETMVGRPWGSGCLGVEPDSRGEAPDFHFAPDQLAALRHLLYFDAASLRQDSWEEFAERQFAQLRCTACHQRDNAGDLWFALEAKAGARSGSNPYDDEEPKTIYSTRPSLTFTGEKLRPEWMERLFAGQLPYKPRPQLAARMPAFPAYAHGLALGFAQEHGLGPAAAPTAAPNPDLAQAGRALIQKGALSCVDCHAVGNQPALAGADTATINFAYLPQRLRREYYDRFTFDPQHLLPGTKMPRFADDQGRSGVTAYFGGNARLQFNAIWNYLLTVTN